jgi:hypothetical protein
MADGSVAVTPGSGANIDTRTVTGGDHRQVVVPGGVGDADIATFSASGSKTMLDVNFAGSAGGAATVTGALTGSGISVSTAIGSSGNGTIVILASGGSVNVPVAFEASLDNTNWVPIDAVRTDGTRIDITTTLPANGVYAWNYIAPGYQYVRVRQTGAATTQGTVAAYITQGPFLYDPSPTVAIIDGQKDTFVASVSNMSTTIASDVFRLSGSATKLIRVTRIEVLCIAGAATTTTWTVQKRSTANSGGTTAATNVAAVDSTQPASSASSTGYTVASTPGTVVGNVRIWRGSVATTGTLVTWDFGGTRPSKCPVLRGAAEGLVINNGTAIGTSGSWTIAVEYTEEPL